MKRRDFLQRVGQTTAALGLGQAGLSLLSDRYWRAIAQPTSRKLALLIGINQYPDLSLAGCVTDVELQRELLVHRFGFQPTDILVLTDRDATRQKIIDAFISHLAEQAKADDVVVFHFSGYGRRISTGEIEAEGQNTLVPVDGKSPTADNPTVNDLLEETLQLLLRSLSTQQVTTILDTSYIDAGDSLLGNLRIRARPSQQLGQPIYEELALQEQLLTLVNGDRKQLRTQQRYSQLPGVVLAAASPPAVRSSQTHSLAPGEKAFEAQWNGFSAGLFTYALTQHLWLATPATPLRVSLSRASGIVEQLAGTQQLPALIGQNSQEQSLPVYYLTPNSELGADGVVTGVEDDGKTAQLWLAGLPSTAIEHYGINSILTLVQSDPATSPLQMQIRSRDGLTAKAKLRTDLAAPTVALAEGQLVQEAIRVVPRNVSLTVAISSELERIERVDATSAFASVPNVSTIVTGESLQPADCLFGKVSEADLVKIGTTSAKAEGSYGLFSRGNALLPSTMGDQGEAVKTAVRRMIPQLKTLRAAKLLRLTDNVGSARLGVKAVLEMAAPQQRILMQREPVRVRAADPVRLPEKSEDEMLTLSIGSRIRYRLLNRESRPLYFLLFGLDDIGSLISISRPANVAVSPMQAAAIAPEKQISATTETSEPIPQPIFKQEVIPASQTLIVPQAITAVEWAISGPPGLAETLLIFSIAPFGQTLDTLKVAKSSTMGDDKSTGTLLNPLEVAQAVLQDLHQASETLSQTLSSSTDSFALDVNAWATLRFIYRVV